MLAPRLVRVAMAALVGVGHLTPGQAAAAVFTRPALRNEGFRIPPDAVALVELNAARELWAVACDGAAYGPLHALDAVSLFCGLLRLGPYTSPSPAAPGARRRRAPPDPRCHRVEVMDLVSLGHEQAQRGAERG